MRVKLPPQDEEKARKLLAALEQTDPRKPVASRLRWLPLVILLSLVLAIALIVLSNLSTFSVLWTRLARPDITPQ